MARVLALAFACGAVASAGAGDAASTCKSLPPIGSTRTRPSVNGGSHLFIGGALTPWHGPVIEVTSPVYDEATASRAAIGTLARMDDESSARAAKAAAAAWDDGQGEWPRASLRARATALRAYLDALVERRAEIVEVLTWEIAKTVADAEAEFDRTMVFAREVLDRAVEGDAPFKTWTTVGGVNAVVRRGPVGVSLLLAPFNYPINEMYAMMIPALVMGNPVIVKLPAIGALAHILTIDALRATLPDGVVNFVSGGGRETLPAVMRSGVVDLLGFIGGSKGADALITQHPRPHRLRVFSQLEGNNLGVVFPDADLEATAAAIIKGALSYNGQRCTAIKLVVAHRSVADALVAKLAAGIDAMGRGAPWDANVSITPLPEPKKPAYLAELIADALDRGATIANARGGDTEGQLFHPALLYPVTAAMRVFGEEQFGPVVPVAVYDDVSEVIDIVKHSWNGQQCALFATDAAPTVPLVDALSSVVGRINVNMPCARGPDVLPFSGRRSSAMGTMSTTAVLREFSVETVVATPAGKEGERFGADLASSSVFLDGL